MLAVQEKTATSVSIVTVAYNCAEKIARTIESVLNQTVPCKEYFIKDGASSDDTVAVARSYAAAFAEKGIDYRVISSPDAGMYDALNEVIALCSGTIVGSVNAGDYYEPIAVETVLAEYEKQPFDMMFGDLRMVRPNKPAFIKSAKLRSYLTTRYWNHPTTFITKEVYGKEKYRCASQVDDGDLYLRLRRGNYRVHAINTVLSNFSYGDGMSTTKNLRESLERAALKWDMYRRNGCGILYWCESYGTEMVKYLFL